MCPDWIQAFFFFTLLNSYPSKNLGRLAAGTFRLEVSAKKHILTGDSFTCQGQGCVWECTV